MLLVVVCLSASAVDGCCFVVKLAHCESKQKTHARSHEYANIRGPLGGVGVGYIMRADVCLCPPTRHLVVLGFCFCLFLLQCTNTSIDVCFVRLCCGCFCLKFLSVCFLERGCFGNNCLQGVRVAH